jgi:hypothetical protein
MTVIAFSYVRPRCMAGTTYVLTFCPAQWTRLLAQLLLAIWAQHSAFMRHISAAVLTPGSSLTLSLLGCCISAAVVHGIRCLERVSGEVEYSHMMENKGSAEP